MADSIRERIMANIETTLKGIAKSAGYNYDMAHVERKAAPPSGPTVMPAAYILEGEEETNPDNFGLHYRCSLPVTLHCFFASYNEPYVAGNRLLADLQKAMEADPGRADLAEDTKETMSLVMALDIHEPRAEVMVVYEVVYRRKRDDPTQQ